MSNHVSNNDTAPRWLAIEAGGRAPRAWPRYMTARVAADYADTSAWTIRRHVQPCGRRGRSFVYSIEAVEIWMRGEATPARNASEPPISKPRRGSATPRARVGDLAKVDRVRPAVAADETNMAA